MIKAEFDHSVLEDKEWRLSNDDFKESSSIKLDNLKVEIGQAAHNITQRTETKLQISARTEDLEIYSEEFTILLIPALELQLGYCEYSYVFNQNQFPLINLLELTNNSRKSLRSIEVKATFDPNDFNEVPWNIDELYSKQSIQLDEQRVSIPISALEDLIEEKSYNLSIEVIVQGKKSFSVQEFLENASKNQWGGESNMPNYLHPSFAQTGSIDFLLKRAANSLAKTELGSQLDGYRSKTREKPYAIGAHLWSAIYDEGITYAYPPSSFATSGQKIRLQDDIFKSRQATCLDSVLICSLS